MKDSGKRSASILAGILCAGAALACGAACGGNQADIGQISVKGESRIIENPDKPIEAYSPEENAYVAAGRLKKLESYRTEVTGKVVAGFFGYTQTIEDVRVKNGEESFTQAKSTSAFVNVGKQAFFKGGRVVMREASNVKKNEWKDACSVATLEEYRAGIGSAPTELSNYILNDETILNAELVSVSDGLYTYRYEIDPEAGTVRYAVKMMRYGGLNALPVFESCTLELTVDADWNPVRLKAEDKYTADKSFLGEMSCTSTLTETFYDLGGDTEIPDAEFFRAKLNESERADGTV